jgi:uncharacterized protein YbjT (DUF2867 family)
MYVITGAAGNTGKIVATELLAQGKKVRAVGRSAEHLQPLISKGAEAFIAALEDGAAVQKAFAGATAVYGLIPPNMAAADDFRSYQNRVAKNQTDAIKANGVKYVVNLSSVGGDRPDHNGPVGGLYDFEQMLNALPNVNVLNLRPGYFMENFFASVALIKGMGINGSAIKPELKFPVISTYDIGRYAAKRLLALDFSGKSFQDLGGPRDISMPEATAALGKAIGRPELPYVCFSYEDAIKGMSGMGLPVKFAELYADMARGLNEGLMKPQKPRTDESTTPTSIEDFAPIFAAVFNQQR